MEKAACLVSLLPVPVPHHRHKHSRAPFLYGLGVLTSATLALLACLSAGEAYYRETSFWPIGSLEILCAINVFLGLFGVSRALGGLSGTSAGIAGSIRSARTWGFIGCILCIVLALGTLAWVIPRPPPEPSPAVTE